MTCRRVQEDIAVALLTGDPLNAAARRHVDTCAPCASEEASLRAVTAVMATLPAIEITRDWTAPADELLLRRILDATSREREREHRRSLITRGVAVAAAVIIGVLGVGMATGVLPPHPHTISATASGSGILATADIAAKGDGSTLDISVTGMPEDTDCVVHVVSKDGHSEVVAQWRVEYEDTAHVTATASIPPEQITEVSFTQPDGTVLLAMPVVP